MFGIDFPEFLIIACIALVVVGPQKLPKLAAQVGRWTGRARTMARQLRDQLEQEVNVEEMMREQEKTQKKSAAAPVPPAAESATVAPHDTPPSGAGPS